MLFRQSRASSLSTAVAHIEYFFSLLVILVDARRHSHDVVIVGHHRSQTRAKHGAVLRAAQCVDFVTSEQSDSWTLYFENGSPHKEARVMIASTCDVAAQRQHLRAHGHLHKADVGQRELVRLVRGAARVLVARRDPHGTADLTHSLEPIRVIVGQQKLNSWQRPDGTATYSRNTIILSRVPPRTAGPPSWPTSAHQLRATKGG